ncbi:helix-turn-helix transcriptional regulator [Ruficoccus amylovorans]|uniref:Helix-turn-helix transcriptional regulator n=1 Tax=Ruficoccus amylovorans TaxID=1804625 RepID=A0A842HI04_9BACT|nr:AraC family transcriptional regulator [Ruficoccus amylovorans]MBC2595969.1 helix-turn-helix transcriptional regulator [Ruficoccus amylovorans]
MTDAKSIPQPSWLPQVGDLADHYHGHVWGNGVMPNNYLFFYRTKSKEMIPAGVSHTLHRRYELVINYTGKACVCSGDRVYRFHPGMAILMEPGNFHRYFGFPHKEFSWLFFTFELLVDLNLGSALNQPVRLEDADMEMVADATRVYLSGQSESNIFETALRMGRLAQAMGKRDVVAEADDVSAEDLDTCQTLRRITHFVDENMSQALRIDDIAEYLGVSESNLRKTFRESYGVSLGSYLRYSRLTRGVQLMHRSDISVSDIAKLSGFESIYSFSQSFSRAIGMSPSAYRSHLEQGRPPLRITLTS